MNTQTEDYKSGELEALRERNKEFAIEVIALREQLDFLKSIIVEALRK